MPRMLDGQPKLYEALFAESLAAEIPDETKATCGTCAMCDASSVDQSRRFRPDTKCCTYHPKLPNFLVGALLADDDPDFAEGRARVRDKIARKLGATPQWLKPPAKYEVLYKSGHSGFGRAKSLRCPYYVEDGGLCSIWPYREAVCSTFFCKHVGGADGRAFWMSFKRYLSLAEIQLARHALLQHYPEWVMLQGDSPKTPELALSPDELDDEDGSAESHVAQWGRWAGREEELYRLCYDTVRSVSRDQFARIMGLDGDIHVAVLEQLRHAVISPRLPPKPKLNPGLTVRHLPDGAVAIGFHSEHDALAIPEEGWRLLAEFRGEATLSEVRHTLRERHGADFSDEIFAELHRHRVLI